jgi:nicotinate-nucleotide adenylyltransferase
MRILLYGGTFNPPHLGHVQSLKTAVAALKPDRVYVLPDSIPPHKPLAEESPDSSQRLEMTKLAVADLPGAQVLDIELNRPGKSYTADTLRLLKQQHPQDELVFLLGTDMFLSLQTWHEPETVCALATIALFARETDKQAEIQTQADYLKTTYHAQVLLLAGKPVEVSSSQVRSLLPQRQGRELLPPAVYGYIVRTGLYGARPDLAWLRQEAHRFLKPTRVPHVLGTEQEAVRLAKRWGLSPEQAAEAAICHDITKRLEREEQLRLCDKYDIMIDDYERASEKLLHSKTGAALTQDLFGLDEEVIQAIRWHTTGRPDMTDLQKIIYLADYIEPNRADFDGLEELRKTAYEDLDAAMELGMRMSLAEVAQRGYAPHENTVTGHAWYLARLREKGKVPVHAEGIPDAS